MAKAGARKVEMSNLPGTKAPLIISIEGPSAVGKTSLARELERSAGAAVIPELSEAPAPGADALDWFVAGHAKQLARACELRRTAEMIVLDGDPFKGLWWTWIYGSEQELERVLRLHARAVELGTLFFPDLYVALQATEAQLRERCAGDPTRRRRHFDRHLLLVEPQQRYFREMHRLTPDRVLLLQTNDRESLPQAVIKHAETTSPRGADSADRLDHLASWLRAHDVAV